MEDLFRAEAIEGRKPSWLGDVRVQRPKSFAMITTICVAIFLCLLAFVTFGETTRVSKLPGIVAPCGGILYVKSSQPGVVSEITVSEGQFVRKGDAIARLVNEHRIGSNDAMSLVAEALAQRRSSLDSEIRLTSDQHNIKLNRIRDKIESLKTEENQAIAELEGANLRVNLSEKTLEKFRELANGGFVSAFQVQARQEELLDLQLRSRAAERVLERVRSDLLSTKSEELEVQTMHKTASAQIARAISTLAQESVENGARRELTITSPIDGNVATINQQVGQTIQIGQILLSIMPSSQTAGDNRADSYKIQYEIQLYGPSRSLGFAKVGQEVRIKYDAYPFEKFGIALGKITSISNAPISPQDLPMGQAQALLAAVQTQEPLYRVSVAPTSQSFGVYGENIALRPGMTVRADIFLERRKIWEWIFDPLLSAVRPE